MKRVMLSLVAMIFIVAMFIFVNKLYYPKSPIAQLSAKGILEKLDDSKEDVVMLATEKERTWYITRSDRNGMVVAEGKIKV